MKKGIEYWTKDHLDALEQTKTFSDIGKIALNIQNNMPQNHAEVCGPISTGGVGSIEDNMYILEETIKKIESQGQLVFNQAPMEDAMHRIYSKENIEGYPWALLEDIYLPLFINKKNPIKTFYFINDWRSSTGAKWEHVNGLLLEKKILYLPENYLQNESSAVILRKSAFEFEETSVDKYIKKKAS